MHFPLPVPITYKQLISQREGTVVNSEEASFSWVVLSGLIQRLSSLDYSDGKT